MAWRFRKLKNIDPFEPRFPKMELEQALGSWDFVLV